MRTQQPNSNGFNVSSPGFAIAPYALMDQFNKPLVLAVYLWLYRHGHGSVDGCWASVDTISEESGVGINNVRKILQILSKYGWVNAIERPGYTTLYKVHVEPRKHPSRKREDHPSRNCEGTPHEFVRRTRSPEQEPIEPPVIPQQPKAAKATAAPVKPPSKGLAVVSDDTFAEFGQGASVALLDWWQNHKTGAKSDMALKLQLTELRKIQAMGGNGLVQRQAEAAIRNGVMRGKGWMQIDASRCNEYSNGARSKGSYQTPSFLPSQELLDIVELAKTYPQYFIDATIAESAVVIKYSKSVQAAMNYPASSKISMKSSLTAEIDHFRSKLVAAITPF
jgi:hypothetical protein